MYRHIQLHILITRNKPTCLTLEKRKPYRHIGRMERELHSFFRLPILFLGKDPPMSIEWEAEWAPDTVQKKNILSHTRIELRFLDLILRVIFSQ